jgi:uncharacterized membrane protein
MDKDRQISLKEEQRDINQVVGRVLAAGVYTTSALFLMGMILLLVHGGSGVSGASYSFSGITEFITRLIHLDPIPFLVLGTVALIATPILRVVISIFAFAREGDRTYVGITVIVAAIIGLSVLIATLFGLKLG